MTVLTSTHWGVYEVEMANGQATALRPFSGDPDPSPIGLHALSPEVARMRVARPAIRKSWLEHGPGHVTTARGTEPFVEVDWPEALDLVARELDRVKKAHGNKAIFGGSYGWSSAGRFHHAQSQIHRFLNVFGGYVRHMDSYSLGAARVLMPHIVASMDELMAIHTSWDVMAAHTKLFVTFGGVPDKNAQVSAGGPAEHRVRPGLAAMRKAGTRFINISPVRDNLAVHDAEWIAIRPNTDAALLLALAHTLYTERLHDPAFLGRCCVGFERFLPYLLGTSDGVPKDAEWAAAITTVPADRIRLLAREMAGTRTMLNIAWALQRAHHGEQPFWAMVTVAAMLGQIGLPGGGFGVGYGAVNLMGSPHPRVSGPTLSQGTNAVADFIPVARISDMLLNPGARFDYNGASRTYPDIRLIYWAGGNPYHHHQDLNRLRQAWAKPDTIVVHEQFWTPTAKLADIVLPATTTLERDDIGSATREKHIIAMKQVMAPAGQARDDYDIFVELARRLGVEQPFTEGLDKPAWLRRIYEEARSKAAKIDVHLPSFDSFWQQGIATIEADQPAPVMLSAFRGDPEKHRLGTPSGRIEIFSERIAGFGYEDCPGHPTWFEPVEWLGGAQAARHPLHLLSDQPVRRLHSQLDHSPHSVAGKRQGREPVMISTADAGRRGIRDGDAVRIYNDRGSCLSVAVVSPDIREGVAKLSTGAWFDPASAAPDALEKHGNPNVLTLDVGASKLSQGCIAQTCLVEIERWEGPLPALTAHTPPAMGQR